MLKKGLFLFILACLSLPMVQQAVPFFESEPLWGYFTIAADTSFSWNGWFEGAYQHKKEAYLNDHAGFRPDLIRIKNQMDLELYHKVPGATVGKSHCLFYDNYIDAYLGVDYIGDSAIRAKMLQLKALQDTFRHLGKSLVLVYEPDKASYYPEYLPDNRNAARHPTNYKTCLRIGDSMGINQVDLNAWFLKMKDTTKELLFSKAGIHWTVYGAILAGDSLVRYIENVRGLHLPHASWTRVEHFYDTKNSDGDIERVANLLFHVNDQRYAYPVLKYPVDTTSKKPKVVIIGDSFVFNLLNNDLPQQIFSDWQFWFYFKFINNKHTSIGGDDKNPVIEHDNWQAAIDSTDCIVLMYTSINLSYGRNELGSGFIEQEYQHYYPAKNKQMKNAGY